MELALAVTGGLGGNAGIAPRVFLRKTSAGSCHAVSAEAAGAADIRSGGMGIRPRPRRQADG